jgi:hypothetical protein
VNFNVSLSLSLSLSRSFLFFFCLAAYVNVGWMLHEGMPVCSMCRKEFSLSPTVENSLKHNCRSCGNVYCSSCCSNHCVVDGLEECGPQRTCNLCYYGQVKPFLFLSVILCS